MKKILIAMLFVAYVASAAAQKLDKIQSTSVWGPVYERVDLDKTYKFEAFNPATELFYTISNDNHKLYLQVQIQNDEVIEKAVKGGITFSLSSTKRSEDNFSVKYPLLGLNDKINLDIDHKLKITETTPETKKLQLDTLLRNANKRIALAAKSIKVAKGSFKPDTLSIYNESGIQVLSFFDPNLSYNYQLSIPLSLLKEVTINDSFVYNIALTGLQFGEFSKVIVKGIDRVDVVNGHVIVTGPTSNKITALINKTDLSGEYKLTKNK